MALSLRPNSWHPEDPHRPGVVSDQWHWSVALGGPADELRQVAYVAYLLHPSFPAQTQVVRRRDTQFLYEGTTWGGFPVRARVVLEDGRVFRLQTDLNITPKLEEPIGNGPTAKLILAKRFKAIKSYDYARKWLLAAQEELRALPAASRQPLADVEATMMHQLALCTYKDQSLPRKDRLDAALTILRDRLKDTDDPETLGLAGAIHKRKWDVDGLRTHLEHAFRYYRRGFEFARKITDVKNPHFDQGYNGINAAYLLDLLANLAEGAGTYGDLGPAKKREEAAWIRTDLVKSLDPLREHVSRDTKWWTLATLAEAFIGLGDRENAAARLRETADLTVDDWEKESTTTQLANLIRLQERWLTPGDRPGTSPMWSVLRETLLPTADPVLHGSTGKVGLALSGGGFRASLFHLGVLARLAELDVLRHVEVLSCVSGGSIVGAHYYLEIRRLLQTKADAAITRQDYVDLVRRMQHDFLAGVQTNIRTRVIADLCSSVQMMLSPHDYSRTEVLGDLYESQLYARVHDGEQDRPRYLSELFIQPCIGTDPKTGQPVPDTGFEPRRHNWRRRAKVPVLILNATTLNTGHSWQFTAAWMGEPPPQQTGVDGNTVLQRTYYSELPERYQRFRLGQAVAASSCVPVLFDPLVLPGLFPEHTVRLVDGGVHDNQGTDALLEQDCALLLVSDASGQMFTTEQPSPSALGVALRADAIAQSRVREAEYREVDVRMSAGLLKGLMFLHLRRDLSRLVLNPLSVAGPTAPTPPAFTPYGIPPTVQEPIARLRTDLDTFTDVEAFALMLSGYRMAEWQFGKDVRWAKPLPEGREPWPFLALEDSIRGETGATPGQPEVRRQLDVGSQLALKAWQLAFPLRVLGLVLLGGALAGLVLGVMAAWGQTVTPSITVGWLVCAALPMVAGCLLPSWLTQLEWYRDALRQILLGLILSIVGWIVAWIHLLIFDCIFRRCGRVTGPSRAARPLCRAGDGALEVPP